MKKTFTKKALFFMMVLGMAFVSCTDKAPVKEVLSNEPTATVPDGTPVVTIDNNLKAHQEDIQELWESYIGEDKKMAKYALAKDYVFLSTEDGKEGLLLSFYKDMKDTDNFDGIAVCEGQELAFQGDWIVVKTNTDEEDITTYYEKTEHEGFNELLTVSVEDGQTLYIDELGWPFPDKEAKELLEKISKASTTPLIETLSTWNNL